MKSEPPVEVCSTFVNLGRQVRRNVMQAERNYDSLDAVLMHKPFRTLKQRERRKMKVKKIKRKKYFV